MAKANGYMNDRNLSLGNSKIDLNDFYHQQDQGTFDYLSTSHSLIQDMDTLMYTQQHGPNDKTLTDVVTTTPGVTYFDQNESAVYTTTNSEMVGSCTTSGQNTLPRMTGSSSNSTMETDTTTMIIKTSNSATTASTSSPPSSTWTPSASPLSTSSASLTCANAPLLLPVSSSDDPSFLSSLSPPLSMGTNVDTINYTSNDHHQLQQQHLDAHLSTSFDYSSPMSTIYHQQPQHSLSINKSSLTLMPHPHHPSLTSATSHQTTALPTGTTSHLIPTAVTLNNDIQASPSELQHSTDFKVLSQPIHGNEEDQDMSLTDHSRNQPTLSTTSNTELRRQIHIQSEQKRRAQIKDGFEDLRNELPSCLNKKMSKVALLQRTVQHIQHLKSTQITILGELERLMNENEHLKKFQVNVIPHPGSMKPYDNTSSI